jgi:hypothetical protein
MRRLQGERDQRTLHTLAVLAVAQQRAGALDMASRHYQQLVPALSAVVGPDSDRTLAAVADAAGVEHALGRCAEARDMMSQVIAVHSRRHGAGHPVGIRMTARLAAMWRDCGDFARARDLVTQARAHAAALPPGDEIHRMLASATDSAANPQHRCGAAAAAPVVTPHPQDLLPPHHQHRGVMTPHITEWPDDDVEEEPATDKPRPAPVRHTDPIWRPASHENQTGTHAPHTASAQPPGAFSTPSAFTTPGAFTAPGALGTPSAFTSPGVAGAPGAQAPGSHGFGTAPHTQDTQHRPHASQDSAGPPPMVTPAVFQPPIPAVRMPPPPPVKARNPARAKAIGVVAMATVAAAAISLVAVSMLAAGDEKPSQAEGGSSPAPAVEVKPSAAPVAEPSGPVANLRLVDNGDTIQVSWAYPANARGPIIVSAAPAGEPMKALQSLPAGTESFTLPGLNPDRNYCVTVAIAYRSDHIVMASPACTSRKKP